MAVQLGTLAVTRSGQVTWDLIRRYRIWINECPLGSVGRGETARFVVGAGPHAVQVSIDWCGSPELEINIRPGRETHVDCGPSRIGSMILLYLSDHYLALDQAELLSEGLDPGRGDWGDPDSLLSH